MCNILFMVLILFVLTDFTEYAVIKFNIPITYYKIILFIRFIKKRLQKIGDFRNLSGSLGFFATYSKIQPKLTSYACRLFNLLDFLKMAEK